MKERVTMKRCQSWCRWEGPEGDYAKRQREKGLSSFIVTRPFHKGVAGGPGRGGFLPKGTRDAELEPSLGKAGQLTFYSKTSEALS